MKTYTSPETQYSDLRFWMNYAVEARIAIQAAVSKYGSTPAQVTAIDALTVTISEYRHRMHALTMDQGNYASNLS